MLQIFILAAVAIFLFWRLRAVLGSRDGFEKTIKQIKDTNNVIKTPDAEDVPNSNNPDDDIFDYVEENSKSATAFKEMKEFDSDFSVNKFVSGAKIAYEIILMAFEKGDVHTMNKGDLFYISSEPHDSWVVGKDDYISLHFIGADKYAD